MRQWHNMLSWLFNFYSYPWRYISYFAILLLLLELSVFFSCALFIFTTISPVNWDLHFLMFMLLTPVLKPFKHRSCKSSRLVHRLCFSSGGFSIKAHVKTILLPELSSYWDMVRLLGLLLPFFFLINFFPFTWHNPFLH